MLRIVDIGREPIHQIAYLNARSGGGTESNLLDISRAYVTGLPEDCAGIIVASDLQGVAPSWEAGGSAVLLGLVLAEQLEDLAETGAIPDPSALGVILAGDLFSVPRANKRGGFGDVSHVWRRFAQSFRWVAGVAGNHDGFGSPSDYRRLTRRSNVHVLDGDSVNVNGIRIGGVGYIAGNPHKPGRRHVDDQLAGIDLVLEAQPDVLVLHEGPNGGAKQRGDISIRARIEAANTQLTICGHRHWDHPLAMTADEKQFLNVDARVLLLAP